MVRLRTLAACGLAIFLGCANDSRRPSADPLIGGETPLPARTETAVTAPRSNVPPLPAPSSATSNAALAGGAFQPLDPTRDLRIGSNDGNAAAGAWRGPAGAASNPTQPVNDPPRSPQLTSQPRPASSPASGVVQAGGLPGASTDALMALLQARGATFQRLETAGDDGEWKYSCSVPHPSNPNIRRTYEARGRDPRSAMVAVLKQMDQEQH
jgi:hypothetical protein